jgi:hypothetical protein
MRLVTHGTDRVVPLLWATDADSTAVAEALEADDSTDEVALVSRRNHDSLFRMRWTADVRFVTHVPVGEDDAVSSTDAACEDQDIDIDVTQIYHRDDAPSLGGFNPTDEQFETVRTALERGYYKVPRETTLEELAEHFDVSHQALSERLRRAHETVITNALYHKIHRRDHDVSPQVRHEAD